MVLIETYWNVKKNKIVRSFLASFVLIETYWNVKDVFATSDHLFDIGINRNILECKDNQLQKDCFCSCSVLIETYWNVKPDSTPPIIFINMY